MSMERVLSMGERLQKLLDGAESEAERKVAEAKRRAEEMISKARTDAENKRARAQRGRGIDDLIQTEELKAKKEAADIMKDYKNKAESAKNVLEERFEEAVNLVLKEVLPR